MPDPDVPAVRLVETTLHGHRMAYRTAGDPDLPVLLLVHGMSSSSATWERVIPGLATHAHVIAPDLFGHGASDKPRGDYSLGAFATSLRDLLEHLGHDRASVVGHSLGGGVALQFVYQHPERCERLGLVSSGGLGREVSWVLRAAALPGSELILPIIAHGKVRDAGQAAAGLLAWVPLRLRPSVVEAARSYATLADEASRTAFLHTLRSVVEPGGQRVAATDRLYLSAGRPTMIVWGALDTIIPVSHAYVAHDALPGSRLEIFEQASHFPHVDEPARFVGVLSDFVRSTTPAIADRAQLRELLASGVATSPDVTTARPAVP